jgi:hypothetical protein
MGKSSDILSEVRYESLEVQTIKGCVGGWVGRWEGGRRRGHMILLNLWDKKK